MNPDTVSLRYVHNYETTFHLPVRTVILTVNVINACFLWAFLKVFFKTFEVRILLIQSVVVDFNLLI